MPERTVRLHRVLRADPERVYKAFLDADATAKWLPPYGFTCKVEHMVAERADPVFGSPGLAALDSRSGVKDVMPCQSDDIASTCSTRRRKLAWCTEESAEAGTTGAEVLLRCHAEVDFETARQKEYSVDRGA